MKGRVCTGSGTFAPEVYDRDKRVGYGPCPYCGRKVCVRRFDPTRRWGNGQPMAGTFYRHHTSR